MQQPPVSFASNYNNNQDHYQSFYHDENEQNMIRRPMAYPGEISE
jgi:hypothetical protein